ncbi:sulfotransferase [Streptosporangium sp. NPDC023825]|uniref:sulfotransferase n=1 Tax=Streptosporangium sp. NPDC023825 TaxID=3154909 RepID=UPI0034157534
MFGGRPEDRDHCLEVLRAHVKKVWAATPAERLPVFRGEERREPFFQFPDAPIPDMPFPQANEGAAFRRKRPRRPLKLIIRGRGNVIRLKHRPCGVNRSTVF